MRVSLHLCSSLFCSRDVPLAPSLGPLPGKRPPHALRTLIRTTAAHPSPGWHTLTGPAFDASLGSRHGEDGEAVIILRAARLDGAYVAVAASSEHAGQIQRLHSLRLHLPEHGLAHGLKLAVECISQLCDGRYKLAQMDSDDWTKEQRFTWVLVSERV